jgi:hypothetical protein
MTGCLLVRRNSLAYISYHSFEKLIMRTIIILMLAIFISQEAAAMSFFNPGKTCVFSHVTAQLTLDGEPLKNVTVIRRWEWNELREDRTQTDERGYFELPPVFESSISRFLPVEIVIAQALFVVVEGEEQRFWSNSKRTAGENDEFQGRPISLVCELTDEMRITREFGSRMNTLCSWGD